MSTTCKAPDCDETGAGITHEGYCSNACYNVGIKVAAVAVNRSVAGGMVGIDDVEDSKVAEIRERVEAHHERIRQKLDQASGEA